MSLALGDSGVRRTENRQNERTAISLITSVRRYCDRACLSSGVFVCWLFGSFVLDARCGFAINFSEVYFSEVKVKAVQRQTVVRYFNNYNYFLRATAYIL